MTVLLPTSRSSTIQPSLEGELASLERYISAVTALGLHCDRDVLVHLFVTLKGHASILIAGPPNTGKIALVRALNSSLGVASMNHLRLMVGHARWASGTRDIARFVELQSRLNDIQILSLMEEARRPENRRHLFIACLTRITPFEIYRYFSTPGFQFWPSLAGHRTSSLNGSLLRYPANFRLIGTMDTGRFRWWDRDLLTNTGIALWSGGAIHSAISQTQPAGFRTDGAFLDACLWETPAAYRKLKRLLCGINAPFGPLLQVSDTMRANGIHLPPTVMNQAARYLANAWSKEGKGLFDASDMSNLRLGLDMALLHLVLPWVAASGQPSPELQQQLSKLLDVHFPKSTAFAQS